MGTDTGKRTSKAVFGFGVGLFLLGLLAVGALYLVPAVWSGHTAPTSVYLIAMCTPVGLLLAIAGAVAQGRRQ
ncbi:hypothetical protein HUN08_03520 [Gordonia sp. X0973]|uniref:hypothetical protein n=1 Tax=Gordonia sp. X0973 TaxID=2742602 RepID=UPI000F5474AD|nr:hypothetical protein [Gordonia sp. X0973]QKT06365.1 hypothetical protein HUN08_03520 [Gordonia sp. X0973]